MTRRADVLDALAPLPRISIHPDDARRLGVTEGGVLKVESHHGAIEGVADVSAVVNPGQLFVPFAYWEAAANKLTGSALDTFGKIPGFKVTAVRAWAG
jgi:formate dehydrogenase major subunit